MAAPRTPTLDAPLIYNNVTCRRECDLRSRRYVWFISVSQRHCAAPFGSAVDYRDVSGGAWRGKNGAGRANHVLALGFGDCSDHRLSDLPRTVPTRIANQTVRIACHTLAFRGVFDGLVLCVLGLSARRQCPSFGLSRSGSNASLGGAFARGTSDDGSDYCRWVGLCRGDCPALGGLGPARAGHLDRDRGLVMRRLWPLSGCIPNV